MLLWLSSAGITSPAKFGPHNSSQSFQKRKCGNLSGGKSFPVKGKINKQVTVWVLGVLGVPPQVTNNPRNWP